MGSVGGYATAVAADGGLVYAAIGARIQVRRAADPDADPLGWTVPLPARIHALAADGGILCAAAGEAGLWIVDVRDPARPSILGRLDLGGEVRGVAVDGGRAFVSVGPAFAGPTGAALVAVDLGQAAALRETGRAAYQGQAGAVEVEGTRAFIIEESDGPVGRLRGLGVYDIAGPTPLRLGGLPDIAAIAVNRDRALALSGDYADLVVLDLSSPDDPSPIARQPLPAPGQPPIAAVLALGEQTAIVSLTPRSDPRSFVVFVDLRDPRAPMVAEGGPIGGEDLVLVGDQAYVAAGARGLFNARLYFGAVDAGGPVRSEVTEIYLPPWAQAASLAQDGTRSLVGTKDKGLLWVDFSRPREPRLITPSARFDFPISRVALSGSLATMLSSGSLRIGDVSPSAPWSLLSTYTYRDEDLPTAFGGRAIAGALAVAERHAYVPIHHFTRQGAFGPGWINVIDLADPAAPQSLGSLKLSESDSLISDMALQGRSLVVAAMDGLRTVNLRDPARPFVDGWFGRGLVLQDVEVLDEMAFALGADRLHCFSLIPGRQDALIASHALPGIGARPRSLTVARMGRRSFVAFVAAGERIQVWDLSDPLRPILSTEVPFTAWPPRDLRLQGRELQVLTNEGGLMRLRLPEPPPDPPRQLIFLPFGATGS